VKPPAAFGDALGAEAVSERTDLIVAGSDRRAWFDLRVVEALGPVRIIPISQWSHPKLVA